MRLDASIRGRKFRGAYGFVRKHPKVAGMGEWGYYAPKLGSP